MNEQLSGSQSAPLKIGVREFRGNLTTYLRQARQGNTILVTSHDEIVAELHPPSPTYRPRRQPGSLRGRIKLSDDFDQTPQDMLDSMDGTL